MKSTMYINQARLTACEVFDTPSGDASMFFYYVIFYFLSIEIDFYILQVGGLMIMANYWQLVVERDLSIHYATVAHSLTRMVN